MPEDRLQPIKLEPEMAATLRDMEPDIATMEFELAKAKRVGLDVTEMQKRFDEMKQIRKGLLQEYT